MNSFSPKISSILLADSFEKGNRSKVDATGIFNQINVWGLPASREFSIILSINGLEKGDYSIPLSLELPSGEIKSISRVEINVSKKTLGIIEGYKFNVALSEKGIHKISAVIEQTGEKHYTLLNVLTQEWPKLPTGKNLEIALKDPNRIKAARAVLTCGECKSEFIFQVNLDPNEALDDNALNFPEDGVFKCKKCGKIHYTKDIEGQVISQLAKTAK